MTISDTTNQVEKLVQIGIPTFESFYPSLYLDVKSPGKASWVLRYQLHGKRRQFKIGGYGNSDNPSGDDVFTMLSFSEKWPESVRFVKHYESAVLTKPEATFSAFWRQRKRWLSKRSGYSSLLVKATAIITYLANVAAFVSLIAIIVGFGSAWASKLMWVLFIKTLLDLVLTRTISRDLQPHCGIANILMTEIFVAVYVTFLGIFGNNTIRQLPDIGKGNSRFYKVDYLLPDVDLHLKDFFLPGRKFT